MVLMMVFRKLYMESLGFLVVWLLCGSVHTQLTDVDESYVGGVGHEDEEYDYRPGTPSEVDGEGGYDFDTDGFWKVQDGDDYENGEGNGGRRMEGVDYGEDVDEDEKWSSHAFLHKYGFPDDFETDTDSVWRDPSRGKPESEWEEPEKPEVDVEDAQELENPELQLKSWGEQLENTNEGELEEEQSENPEVDLQEESNVEVNKMTLEREDMEEPVEEDGSEEVEREKLEQLDPPEHVKLVEDEEEHSLPDDYDNMSFYQKDSSVPPTLVARPAAHPPRADCGNDSMLIHLPLKSYSQVFLQRAKMALLPVLKLPRTCQHTVRRIRGKVLLIASFRGCYVWKLEKDGRLYAALTIRYYDLILKMTQVATVSCPLKTTQPQLPKGLSISCSEVCMTVHLPTGPLSAVQILDSSKALVPVLQMPKSCGYSLVRGQGKNVLTIPYTACDIKIMEQRYTIQVVYMTAAGERAEIQVSCPYRKLQPRQGCHIPKSQQVSCGPKSVRATACLAIGCCVDPETAHCYYPLEECTSDKQFVFAVHRTLTAPPVDPSSLAIAGNKSCTPVICTPDFAVFKFPVTGCGTHAFVVGETTIYLAEVMAMARRNHLNYGVITRDSPFRLLVECRYAEDNLVSTGYLVKSPYLPSTILSPGVFGVQLRIATDDSYSRFYPQYHRPLWLLLGHPVYLEVRLLSSPDPNLLLLVHYCVAYPRSARAVWVLLYEGCPNPLDYGHTSTLHVNNQLPLPRQHRRFHITTFQFMDRTVQAYLDEEIYFMCSTEVCSPTMKTCVEGCFDGRKIPVVPDPNTDARCLRKPCPGGKTKRSVRLPLQ